MSPKQIVKSGKDLVNSYSGYLSIIALVASMIAGSFSAVKALAVQDYKASQIEPTEIKLMQYQINEINSTTNELKIKIDKLMDLLIQHLQQK